MAALCRQKEVELMRWRRDGVQLAYFTGGWVLQNLGLRWKRLRKWNIADADAERRELIDGGWVQVGSMGERLKFQHDAATCPRDVGGPCNCV
jgi:hypothetical protein